MTAPRLTLDQVREIAGLARLAFPEDELREFAAHLGAIVGYVSVLDEAGGPPTPSGTPPAGGAGGMPLRVDTVANASGFEVTDRLLAAAPERDGDLVVVPRVLDTE